MTETEQLRAALGKLRADTHPLLDQPLPDQVRKLVEWATSQRPDHFRRTVPVHKDDHDILICNALVRLVDRIEELEANCGE